MTVLHLQIGVPVQATRTVSIAVGVQARRLRVLLVAQRLVVLVAAVCALVVLLHLEVVHLLQLLLLLVKESLLVSFEVGVLLLQRRWVLLRLVEEMETCLFRARRAWLNALVDLRGKDCGRRPALLDGTDLGRGHGLGLLVGGSDEFVEEGAIVEVFDELGGGFDAAELDVDLVAEELHVAVLYLFGLHNRGEGVDEFTGIVPLHLRRAYNYGGRLVARRLRVDALALEVLALVRHSRHLGSH